MWGVIASFGVLAVLVIADLLAPKTARRARRTLLILIIAAAVSVIVFGALVVVETLMG